MRFLKDLILMPPGATTENREASPSTRQVSARELSLDRLGSISMVDVAGDGTAETLRSLPLV